MIESNMTAETAKKGTFAELFEQSLKDTKFAEGEIVKGTIIRVSKDRVIIDIGYKSEGRLYINEFTDATGAVTAKPGDTIEVFIERIEDDYGFVRLSKERADAMKTWDKLVECAEKNEMIEGVVLMKVKGGLCIDIGVKAFLPGSQLDVRPVRNLDKFVGKKLKFKILKLNKKRGNVVLSRKAVVEKEREELRKETLANLHEGQILEGCVKNITDYGVFVDLGGIDGLLHITDITWGRVNHPSEVFAVGDEIRVKVLKYDAGSERVSLGYKQLSEDPWRDVANNYQVGSRVQGKVTSITDYGAFIELQDGVEGLVHVSEMSWTKKVKHPSKVVSVGDMVDSVVLDVDTENKRISLGMKQIESNPWDTLQDKFSLGSRHTGTIKNVADFGLFVDVGADVDGLVHISDLFWVQNVAKPSEVYKKGDTLEVVVIHIDPENERFSLGVRQFHDDPWDKINSNYTPGIEADGKVKSSGPAGTIVELEAGIEGLIPKEVMPEGPADGSEIKVLVKQAEPKERKFILEKI